MIVNRFWITSGIGEFGSDGPESVTAFMTFFRMVASSSQS